MNPPLGGLFFKSMDIRQYLDSTYLKTAAQASLSEAENRVVAKAVIAEAIEQGFKLVMVRPDMVPMAKEMVADANSKLGVGTVIDFPLGSGTLKAKLAEAREAIANGADDLDFVINYTGFKNGAVNDVKREVFECTGLGLENGKIVKWIIEVAALNEHEIVQLSALVKNVVLSHFNEEDYNKVFVKSSTGFYRAQDGKPNGATMETIKLMVENAWPLHVKAAGGVRTYDEAIQMILLGVKRIGTSSAKAIAGGGDAKAGY